MISPPADRPVGVAMKGHGGLFRSRCPLESHDLPDYASQHEITDRQVEQPITLNLEINDFVAVDISKNDRVVVGRPCDIFLEPPQLPSSACERGTCSCEQCGAA
jgi:hypothetical protein